MAALGAMISVSVMAQRPDMADMQERKAEMIEKKADKLAKDFELQGDSKDKFVATYKAYQNELLSVNKKDRPMEKGGEQKQEGEKKKKVSDEEATKLVEKYFANQEEQIAKMQNRLAIEKKYYEELKSVLTPQQLARVFRQPKAGQGHNAPQGRPGGSHEGFGGGRPNGHGGPGGFGGEF